MGFLGSAEVKNPPNNVGDLSLIPGLGRSPGVGNSMDRRAWWAAAHSTAESDTTEYIGTYA